MATATHKHAAIMFSDIVGYTALMGSDEDRAFEILRKNREIHSKFIERFNGALIKEMGDGMLISFDLVSDAVRCAIELQKASKKQDIPLKIGIHEGEVVFEGNDVLGDGVNISSRIQDKAEKGYILVSGSVYRDIKNKHDIKTRFAGEATLKNVEESIRVFVICYDGCPDPGTIAHKLSRESSVHKSFFRRPLVGISSSVILLTGVVIFILFYRGTTVPFKERDWIVISDFENVTNEEIFDQSLNTAFALSINQSTYVNVTPKKRMKETLLRMKRESTEKIDEETAREIAVREGVDICVIPSISKVGDQYILSAEIQDATSGDILKSEVLYADDQNEILNSLDKLSRRTRRNLGESRYDIYSQSKPLSKVTTSSLDALKEFSLGIEDHINLDCEQAKIHYENAIKIDSNFVSAKASLGNLLFECFDKEEGRKWIEEAITSLDHLTEREQYGILAFHAVNVENDLSKGIEYTKSRIDLYPDDPVARNNLGWYYHNSGMYEKAVTEYKRAVELDPYLMLAYSGLLWIQTEKLARLDSSLVWSEKMIEKNPDNQWGYFYLGTTYVGLDSIEQALIYYQKSVDLNPRLLLSHYRLAHVYRKLGQYERSNEVLRDIEKIVPNEIALHYMRGINYRLLGNEEMAMQSFKIYLEKADSWLQDFPDHAATYTSLGAGWTQLGEKQKGFEIGSKALELDSTSHFQYAVFLSVQGKRNEAIDHLEKALKNGYRDIVWIKLNPDLDVLRDDSRYKSLMAKYFG
jgi:adenylate cyclase